MKIGDMVRDNIRGLSALTEIGIVISEPISSVSCKVAERHILHDFLEDNYHMVKVKFLTSRGAETVDCFLSELEVISEGR
jgi:hypothetical protein